MTYCVKEALPFDSGALHASRTDESAAIAVALCTAVGTLGATTDTSVPGEPTPTALTALTRTEYEPNAPTLTTAGDDAAFCDVQVEAAVVLYSTM